MVPFLARHSLLVAIALIALASLRIVSTYSVFGPTQDEPAHVACGLQFLAHHIYGYQLPQPSLGATDGIGQTSRVFTALGPYLYGCRPLGYRNVNDEGYKVILHSGHPALVLALMRLGIIPFFVLAALVVFVWAREQHGAAVAVCATGIFTMVPSVLAHAGLATTDMALAACLGAAFLSLIRWARRPSVGSGAILGLTAALAALSKSTALGYLPVSAVLALAAYLAVERPGFPKFLVLAKERLATLLLAGATAALTIWAAYWFSWGRVTGWGISLPAPEFLEGILAATRHLNFGHETLLFGKFSMTGWWYFFPVVIAVKTPIALLVLIAAGCWYGWQKRTTPGVYLPVALILGTLLPAMSSKVNIGVRHILPVYIGFSILAAVGLAGLAHSARQPLRIAAGLLVIWLVVTGAINHPDYIPYFNEAIADRESTLADSDLEWGQDRLRLANRFRELGVTEIHYGLTIDHLENDYVWPGLPHSLPISPLTPVEGWTVIHPSIDQMTQYGLFHRYQNIVPWWSRLPVTEKVGQYRLYYLPPGSVRRVQ